MPQRYEDRGPGASPDFQAGGGRGSNSPIVTPAPLEGGSANAASRAAQITSADTLAPVARQLPTGAENDPDLARVLAAWPSLPAPIKAAVLALLDAPAPGR